MFFERHVILDIQRTFTRQNVMAKAFDGNTIKMKTASQANLNNKSNLSNKEHEIDLSRPEPGVSYKQYSCRESVYFLDLVNKISSVTR